MEILPEDIIVSSYPKYKPPWSFEVPKYVSLYHKPTGITLRSEEGVSIHRNTQVALEKLRSIIIEKEEKLCWELYSEDNNDDRC